VSPNGNRRNEKERGRDGQRKGIGSELRDKMKE
jgi:hypothetical protein